ncbi:Hypothetical protein PHPALM_7706 [Phytophthora palmivora]|uniref:Uncharacterized protein n=1 Tax=Phytophthora palmivora TaxID=4796 RepID=A0A2P4YBN3_9STRA|nr:Hypothetical protein PHPALM_7706 [Phytophthora palmivora]
MQQYAKTTEKTNDMAPEWGPEDVNLYKAFILELAEAYAQTDTIFQQCGLGGKVSSETSFYKPIRRLDAVRNIAFFESTSAFVMPKKYPNSAKAMFDAIRQIHDDHACRKLYEKVENAANTIAVKFGTVNHCEGENVVPLSLIAVQQRFEESDRTVLVWRCLIEGEGDFADMCLDETGWCVLRSTPVDSTDIRTCIRSTPIHRCVEKTIDSKERDEEFANAVVRSSQQDSMKLAQLMDQFLLHT